MIRIFIYLLSLTLAQGESLTRAYFIGRDQLWQWNAAENALLNPRNDRDPFATPTVEITPPEPLENPPFESPHFRKGDLLYDFKLYKERLKNTRGNIEHAIYNQSTGRIIVQGEPTAHHLFKSLALRIADDSPRSVELSFEFLEEGTPIFATGARGLPGQTVTATAGGGANTLKLEWGPQTYSENHFVDLQLTLDGKIRDQAFNLRTGLILLNDEPATLDIGKTGKDQKILTLSITPHVLLRGDVRISDLILDELGKRPNPKEKINVLHDLYQKGIVDPETGKVLKAFRVPPTFETFLASSSYSDSDPFEETDAPEGDHEHKFVGNPDPRIPALPTDRLIDVKNLLMKHGVSFQKSDFAILIPACSTLYVLNSPLNVELVDEITMAVGSWGMERIILTDLQVIESSQKLTVDSLETIDHQIVARISTAALPGHNSTMILGPLHLEIESVTDSKDFQIESRLTFQIKDKKEPSLLLKSQLLQENGIPQIVQSSFNDGTWKTLVLTSTIKDFKEGE